MSFRDKKIYLAGAMSGLTYADAQEWRDTAIQLLNEYGLTGYSPLRGTGKELGQTVIEGSPNTNVFLTSKGIVSRDHFDVKTSDAILINLLGTERVSIGTVMEIALAWEYRIPVVLICEETNIHWSHPFVNEMVSYRVDTLQDGVDTIADILLP